MVKQIDVLTAKELLKDESTAFVDIRDEISFMCGHPEGAMHLTGEQLGEFILNADKEAPVVVICYHGISSINVGELLVQKGFEDVYSVSGGYEEWKRTTSKK